MLMKFYILCSHCYVIFDRELEEEGSCPCCGAPAEMTKDVIACWYGYPRADDYDKIPKVFPPKTYGDFAELWEEQTQEVI